MPTTLQQTVEPGAGNPVLQAYGELLRLDPGGPVLVGEYTTYDQEERPIYCGRITYRGDAYRFKASLFRF